jgi:hypothetical protein|tara:strand:- start:517 stop:633 length:117 start_codon:yes stop_codon:yes gene_type:complete
MVQALLARSTLAVKLVLTIDFRRLFTADTLGLIWKKHE